MGGKDNFNAEAKDDLPLQPSVGLNVTDSTNWSQI